MNHKKSPWKGIHTTHYAYPFQGEFNKSAIIAIILLILRSFQRKGLCNSGLKAKSTTFVNNIKTEGVATYKTKQDMPEELQKALPDLDKMKDLFCKSL